MTPHGADATITAGLAKSKGTPKAKVNKKYAITGCMMSLTNTIRPEREAIISSLFTLKITPSAKVELAKPLTKYLKGKFEHLELSQVHLNHKANLLTFPKLRVIIILVTVDLLPQFL